MIPPLVLVHREGHVFLRSVPFVGRGRSWLEGDGRAAGHLARVEALLRAESHCMYVAERPVGRHLLLAQKDGGRWLGEGGDLAVCIAVVLGTLCAAMGVVADKYPADLSLDAWRHALGTSGSMRPGGWGDEPMVVWAASGRLASTGHVETAQWWPEALAAVRESAPAGARFEVFCAENSRSLTEAMAREVGMQAETHTVTDLHDVLRLIPTRLLALFPAPALRWEETQLLARLSPTTPALTER